MTIASRWVAVLCAAGLLGLSGCAPVRPAGIGIVVKSSSFYRPPPGAQPAPSSFQPGSYDYSGIASLVIDGQTIAPEAALATLGERYALTVGQITPMDHPSAVRVRVVLPDHDRLRLLALQRTRGIQGGATEFQTEMQRLDLHEVADAVVRSQAFAAADIVEENDTSWPDAAGADDVLWFQVQSMRPNNAGPWVGTWQMRRAAGAATLAVSFDPGTPVGPQRLLSFVRSAQEVAGALAGTPVRAAMAGRPMRAGHPVSGGSGIIIDASGHVLTDNHVIANCLDIRVTTDAGSTPAPARLVANDARLDLALLDAAMRTPAYARFRDSQSLHPGESLVATGFPLTGLVSPEMAVTTGSLTASSGMQGNAGVFQFSAPVQPGNSGGPVLDGSGRVVGITTSVMNGLALAALTGGALPQNVNFATKSNVARDYLARLNTSLSERDGAAADMNAANVADKARAFTVKVECWR